MVTVGLTSAQWRLVLEMFRFAADYSDLTDEELEVFNIIESSMDEQG